MEPLNKLPIIFNYENNDRNIWILAEYLLNIIKIWWNWLIRLSSFDRTVTPSIAGESNQTLETRTIPPVKLNEAKPVKCCNDGRKIWISAECLLELMKWVDWNIVLWPDGAAIYRRRVKLDTADADNSTYKIRRSPTRGMFW